MMMKVFLLLLPLVSPLCLVGAVEDGRRSACAPGCHQSGTDLLCAAASLTQPPPLDACPPGVGAVVLSRNPVERLRLGDLETYANVTSLKLDGCGVREVAGGVFHGLARLRYLDLAGNCLVEVKQEMFVGLEALTFLDLSWNRLDLIFGESLRHLAHLQTLVLTGNTDIVSLAPTTLEHLPSLRYLAANELPRLVRQLPASLFELNPALEKLELRNNSLPGIPTEALRGAGRSLKEFDFGVNAIIESIAPESLVNLTALERLELVLMPRLRRVDRRALVNTPRLRSLWVMNCSRLAHIDPEAFASAGISGDDERVFTMDDVTMKHNALTSLSRYLLPWDEVGELDLRDNPWSCQCQIGWMSQMTNLVTQDQQELVCAAPPEYKGRRILEMRASEFHCKGGAVLHRKLFFTLIIPLLAVLTTTIILAVLAWRYDLWKLVKKKSLYLPMYNMEVTRGGSSEGKEMSTIRPRQSDERAETDYRQKARLDALTM